MPGSPALHDRVAVVTGATRGAGRAIAGVLGEGGAIVYVTGRSTREHPSTDNLPGTIEDTAEEVTARGGMGIPVRCDHSIDGEIDALFDQVRRDHGSLDLLVNNAWGGYEMTVDFSPFWATPLRHWDLMFGAGVRATLATTRGAVPLMLPRRGGLIVNTTARMPDRYDGGLFYDVAKGAIRKMSVDMAHDLRRHGIAVVAVSPGWMRTERILRHYGTDEAHWHEIADLERTESPEYVGRAIAHLAADERVMERSGGIFEVGALARTYGFTDIDGRQVPPFSELYPEQFREEQG